MHFGKVNGYIHTPKYTYISTPVYIPPVMAVGREVRLSEAKEQLLSALGV